MSAKLERCQTVVRKQRWRLPQRKFHLLLRPPTFSRPPSPCWKLVAIVALSLTKPSQQFASTTVKGLGDALRFCMLGTRRCRPGVGVQSVLQSRPRSVLPKLWSEIPNCIKGRLGCSWGHHEMLAYCPCFRACLTTQLRRRSQSAASQPAESRRQTLFDFPILFLNFFLDFATNRLTRCVAASMADVDWYFVSP